MVGSLTWLNSCCRLCNLLGLVLLAMRMMKGSLFHPQATSVVVMGICCPFCDG